MQLNLQLRYLAPIPVGHSIAIDYFETETGFVTRTIEVDREHPMVTDLQTGICWGSHRHWGRLAFDAGQRGKLAERVMGVVRGCWVSSNMGNEYAETYTMLVVDVTGR